MPPVIILGVSFIFQALSLWGQSGDLAVEVEAIAEGKKIAVALPYSRRSRSFKAPATIVGMAFVAGLASFKILTTEFGFPGEVSICFRIDFVLKEGGFFFCGICQLTLSRLS